MGSHGKTQTFVDFLPYLNCVNAKSKRNLKLLIDTGSNKNILRNGVIPEHLTVSINNTRVKNITGEHQIDKKGTINLLGFGLPKQTFYLVDFHNFFDGILGSKYLAENNSIIDYAKEIITINEITIPFSKYFPSKKLSNHFITINTLKNGDRLVPSFQTRYKGCIIKPGLYKAEKGKSTVNVLSFHQNHPTNLRTYDLNVNNFETITPIPIRNCEEVDKNIIEPLIRTQHPSPLEKECLLNTILQNCSVLLREGCG